MQIPGGKGCALHILENILQILSTALVSMKFAQEHHAGLPIFFKARFWKTGVFVYDVWASNYR